MNVQDRIVFELACLWRALNPMKNGPNGIVRKVSTLALVGVWVAVTLGLSPRDPGEAFLLGLTAFVFALVGRMWGIEARHWLDRLSPITVNFGDNNDE